MLRPFHLAIPVKDLESSRTFYGDLMGFTTGRTDTKWIDWNFYGHQIVTHVVDNYTPPQLPTNAVDSHAVPVPHFGVVLEQSDWDALADRLRGKVNFIIEPYTRFRGEPGEQSTMFFTDPSGNALEFKAFADLDKLFAVD